MVDRAVITAAGLGTRLLTATKELPKEMLPVFHRVNDTLYVKPTLQIIFEYLYDAGIREFIFIVSRGKRAIEDHFNADWDLYEYLKSRGKTELAGLLKDFYMKIEDSLIVFINQYRPLGFGDAVLRAEPLIKTGPFLLHAGDDLVVSRGNDHIDRLRKVYDEYDCDAVFLVEEVPDPRNYGVITGRMVSDDVIRVENIVEKPKVPPSNLAIVAIYIFNESIFRALKSTPLSPAGELYLSDAIKRLVMDGYKVYAVKLRDNEFRLDVGTPENYWMALKYTYGGEL